VGEPLWSEQGAFSAAEIRGDRGRVAPPPDGRRTATVADPRLHTDESGQVTPGDTDHGALRPAQPRRQAMPVATRGRPSRPRRWTSGRALRQDPRWGRGCSLWGRFTEQADGEADTTDEEVRSGGETKRGQPEDAGGRGTR